MRRLLTFLLRLVLWTVRIPIYLLAIFLVTIRQLLKEYGGGRRRY